MSPTLSLVLVLLGACSRGPTATPAAESPSATMSGSTTRAGAEIRTAGTDEAASRPTPTLPTLPTLAPSPEPTARPARDLDSRPLALVGARVIDGSGAPAREGWSLLVEGGYITAAGPGLVIPPDAEVLDLSGHTLLPGLMDVHGHLFGYAGRGFVLMEAYPPLYLAGGVTTVFSPGDWDPEGAIRLRAAVARGEVAGPHLLTTGPYFDGPAGASAVLRRYERWRTRIDGVKAYSRMGPEALDALAAAARADGLRITAHLGGVPAADALAMGVDRLEHGVFGAPELWPAGATLRRVYCAIAELDPGGPELEALVAAYLDAGAASVPTFVVYEQSLPEAPPVAADWLRFVAPSAREAVGEGVRRYREEAGDCLPRALERQRAFVGRLHARGGRVLAGSDPVYPLILPGRAIHRELAHLVEAGLSPLAAISAATGEAASALGLADRGRIGAGMAADLVLVAGDPATDIAALEAPVWVMKDGRRYDPEALRAGVEGRIGR